MPPLCLTRHTAFQRRLHSVRGEADNTIARVLHPKACRVPYRWQSETSSPSEGALGNVSRFIDNPLFELDGLKRLSGREIAPSACYHVLFFSERIGRVGMMPKDLPVGSTSTKPIGDNSLKEGDYRRTRDSLIQSCMSCCSVTTIVLSFDSSRPRSLRSA